MDQDWVGTGRGNMNGVPGGEEEGLYNRDRMGRVGKF